MDAYGNPIPGSSKVFECEGIMDSTANCDFAWLENEFNSDDVIEDVKCSTRDYINLSNNQNVNFNEIEPSSSYVIEDFFEEIKSIDFSQNHIFQNINTEINTIKELLERCNNFIDIIDRNIENLEVITFKINENIQISIENAKKAHNCIEFEKKSIAKTPMQNLKMKANLANFFKIGLSNCPQNPHLMELYETGRLILSYNGRFILEECVEKNVWNQEFKNKLEQAIHAEVLDKIKTPMLTQHARLGVDRNIQNDPLTKHKIEHEMKCIEKELEVISNTPFKQLVLQFMDTDTKYDWLHISQITNKPDLQCQRFWNLILKPHISRNKWTKDEDHKLIQIAKKYGEKNWQQIANELDTNRNELQCFVHYQKHKKMLYKKGKWSKEEDQKLTEIIQENSIDTIINWKKVYLAMLDEGRSVDQIYNRYVCSLKPGIKKGFLNEKEKLIIHQAQEKNLPPSVVSMNLTNRTSAQIRNAYRRISSYDPDIFRGSWMVDEDKMLLRAVNPYAPSELTWTEVSKKVPGRNAEQCRHRFKLIENKIQNNPKLTIENFSHRRQQKRIKHPFTLFDSEKSNEYDLQKIFKQNRQSLKFNKPVETVADRRLKKSFLDSIYVTKHCNFTSKCDLFKYLLNYLGADLIVPETFVHEDDLIDEGLMSMMTYIKECSVETLTLQEPVNVEQNMTTDMKFIYEGVHNVLKSSDIINSDFSEVEGLFDIRMRNYDSQNQSKKIYKQNLVCNKKKVCSLPLHTMGSVPPNVETFKMLYTCLHSLNTFLKPDNFKGYDLNLNCNDEESEKLRERLIAILRWPALFSGLVDFNTPKINMIVNTKQTVDLNYPDNRSFNAKKIKPYFNSRKFL